MYINISKYPITKVAYVGATIVPMAVPDRWLKYLSSKKKLLFFITNCIDSKINSLQNRDFIKLGYLSKQNVTDA